MAERERKDSEVLPLLPVTYFPWEISYGGGIRAGPWIFAMGHKGTAGPDVAMSNDVLRPELPEWDKPK